MRSVRVPFKISLREKLQIILIGFSAVQPKKKNSMSKESSSVDMLWQSGFGKTVQYLGSQELDVLFILGRNCGYTYEWPI